MRVKINAFILFLVLCFSCCTSQEFPLPAGTKKPGEAFIPEGIEAPEIADAPEPLEIAVVPEAPEPPPPPEPDYAIFVAFGDNLYHDPMIKPGENGYEFDSVYSEIKTLVENADIAFINQETLLAGAGYGFSGYPRFNTPEELGRTLIRTGFDIVNHATNHIMDKGEKAIFSTMDFWDTIPEATVLGIHRSEEKRALPVVVTVNNIKFGFLAYTCHTNYIPVPKDKPWLVSLANAEIMAREIDALRSLCDFLVVSMHWGDEYVHAYNAEQETLAALLAEHYVDLVIGHHPHVIQPVKTIARPDGTSTLCFYSLGNLVSAQMQNPTLLGAMAYVKVKKNPAAAEPIAVTGAAETGPDSTQTAGTKTEAANFCGAGIIDAGALPLVTHYDSNYTNFRIYPLYAYTEELLKTHRQNQRNPAFTRNYLENLSAQILGDYELKTFSSGGQPKETGATAAEQEPASP